MKTFIINLNLAIAFIILHIDFDKTNIYVMIIAFLYAISSFMIAFIHFKKKKGLK